MDTTKDRLLILMNSMECNQRKFASITGVDPAIISRILKGDFEPNVKNLRKIVETTKTSPSWLLGYGNSDVIERI